MHSSSSSPSLTMTVRILNFRTIATGTGASESPWCVCCGNLIIMTALGGVPCQIASIPYVLGSDVLKSFTFSSPPFPPPLHPPRSQIALGNVLVLHTHPFLPHSPSILAFLFPFLLCCP